MYSEERFLDVQDPDGNQYTLKLEQECFTIGRSNGNDIVLPNPEKTISRQHCILECEANCWRVVDKSSANGTFVIQKEKSNTRIDVRQYGQLKLKNGDVILILGKFLEPDESVFWRLTFRDAGGTEQPAQVLESQPSLGLEYSLSQRKLFLVDGQERKEVHLRPKARTLVHYMAERNQANNNQPVLCKYTDLIEAIWGEPFGHTNNDVTNLVWGVRRKIESDSGEPKFLKTEQGLGYSLKVKVIN